MSDRRFEVGSSFEVNGLPFRVTKGRAGDDDRVLEVQTPRGWRAVKMALTAMTNEFWVENEAYLLTLPQYAYRKEKAWPYFRVFLERALEVGWRVAATELQVQRDKARTRVDDPKDDGREGLTLTL